MATIYQTVKTLLSGDAALTALLSGGVHDAASIAQTDFGGWDWAPKEADKLTLKPHAKIRWRDSNSWQSEHPALGAERETVEIYLYEDLGYSVIRQAVNRIKAMLHELVINTDDRAIAQILFTFASGELQAPEYHNKPFMFVRFSIVHIRK